MIGHYSSATSTKLRDSCASFFKKSRWKISNLPGNPADFLVENGHFLKYNVECIDQSILDFKSSSALMDLMENHAHGIKTWIPLLFVTNFDMSPLFIDLALKRQIIACSIDDLSQIAALPDLMANLQSDLNDRQRALLELNTWACLEFYKLHSTAGNSSVALAWAKKAIKPNGTVGGAHHAVFTILMKAGEMDDAYELAMEAVTRSRDDVFLLRGLVQIATKRGDMVDQKRWKQRFEEAGGERVQGIKKILSSVPAPTSPDSGSDKVSNKRNMFSGFFRKT